jgi:hypothetical protein
MDQHNEKDHKLTPKFFFLSLGVLISLITSVTSLLNLVFETLNNKFPDALNATYQYGYNTYSYDGIRSSIATLIIFFPVFLIVSHFWGKAIKSGISKVDEIIRKWMIYLILFLSSIVVMVDLVMLVRYFVSGEITTRFILKVAVALVVAAYVGVYYIWKLQGWKKMWGFKMDFWAPIKSSILVILAVVWSFMVIGSPSQQRAYRFDDQRVSDLQNIQYQVINYWQQKEVLPQTLADLKNPITNYMAPVDPEFNLGKIYEYKTTGDMSFELCATFSKPMPQGFVDNSSGGRGVMPMANDIAVSSYPYMGGTSDSWDHETGRTCFERTIDKDLYPPYPKPLTTGK